MIEKKTCHNHKIHKSFEQFTEFSLLRNYPAVVRRTPSSASKRPLPPSPPPSPPPKPSTSTTSPRPSPTLHPPLTQPAPTSAPTLQSSPTTKTLSTKPSRRSRRRRTTSPVPSLLWKTWKLAPYATSRNGASFSYPAVTWFAAESALKGSKSARCAGRTSASARRCTCKFLPKIH